MKFTSQDSNTIVEARYDYMGRRAWKKVTVNGNVNLHEAYIYRGPDAIPSEVSSAALVSNCSAICLQIAAIDLRGANAGHFGCPHSVCCADFPQRGVSEARGLIAQPQSVTWDPTQPTATRPLAIEKNGKWYSYGFDLSKNVTELFTNEGVIASSYTYSPFGAVEASGNESTRNPIQLSSEIADDELDLVYYKAPEGLEGDWRNLRSNVCPKGESPMGWGRVNYRANTVTQSWNLDKVQCKKAKSMIEGQLKKPHNYSPVFQCTSAALQVLNSIPVDPLPPNGVGPVYAETGVFSSWRGNVANPYNLSKQLNYTSSQAGGKKCKKD